MKISKTFKSILFLIPIIKLNRVLKMVKYISFSYIMSFYPTKYSEYGWIKERKYTIHDIISICDFFNYPIKRKIKKVMIEECYDYLRKCYFSFKIQTVWKRHIIKYFKKSQGPAIFNRRICNNMDDFLTTEQMSEIDYYFFISFKDKDFVYGFNVISVYNLLKKNTPFNPYTRNPFPPEFVEMIYKRMKLNYLLKKTDHPIYHEIQLPSYDNRLTGLFQKMDSLGNYTQIEWFLKLGTVQLRRFLLELYDIWDYRSQLTPSNKIRICPPYGKPFMHIPLQSIEANTTMDIPLLREYCYLAMDEFINKSDQHEYQCLGCYYILSALTLVNQEVAEAMPWLYQSVV
jgi:hypothetical protein